MRRLLLVLLALLVCAPAASAQDATPTPVPTEEADDGVLDPDEVPPEETATPEAPCADEGADAQYCDPCPQGGADGDYAYCPVESNAGGGAGPPQKRKPAAAVQAQPLNTGSLPYTGNEPGLVALFGAGLLLTGLGLRRAGPSRSG